jgi:hypothetical protein
MSYKTAILSLLAAFLLVLGAGCASGGSKKKDPDRASSLYLNNLDPSSDKSLTAFDAQKMRHGAGDDGDQEADDVGGTIWTIMLETFAEGQHAQMAESVRQGMIRELPELREARVQTTDRGSMIIYGRYRAPDEPGAQTDLARIKQLQFRGAKVFRKAMLTRVEDAAAPGAVPVEGNDLRVLRMRNPRVDPLYTLQVAAFASTPESPLGRDERRRKAEGYAMMLRTQGQDAYYHHDDAREISVVTIGGFDHRAYDPLSTLFSPDVELLMKKFPKHLVNGEEVMAPVDPRRPNGRKAPMTPRLVQVPR